MLAGIASVFVGLRWQTDTQMIARRWRENGRGIKPPTAQTNTHPLNMTKNVE